MTALRRVGFFRELRHGQPEGPSLRGSVAAEPHPEEDRIVAYLRQGAVVAVSGVMAHDVLDGDQKPIAVLATLTDGTWLWPSDLAYYVETYHARLPDDLLRHASCLRWVPPTLDPGALADVEERLFEAKEAAPADGP